MPVLSAIYPWIRNRPRGRLGRRSARFRRLALRTVAFLVSAFLWLVTGGRARAWPRNSLALGYSGAYSDLDLTVFSAMKRMKAEIFLARALVSSGAGEASLYARGDAAWVALANPFEVLRDPRLLREFGRAAPVSATRAEAFVFLLRMRDSDAHLSTPERRPLRAPKWTHHLELVARLTGVPMGEPLRLVSDPAAAVRRALVLLDPGSAASPLGEAPSDLRIVAPHRWLTEARRAGVSLAGLPAAEATFRREVHREQIRWELWGLLGQLRLDPEPRKVIEHLELLGLLLSEEERSLLQYDDAIAYLKVMK